MPDPKPQKMWEALNPSGTPLCAANFPSVAQRLAADLVMDEWERMEARGWSVRRVIVRVEGEDSGQATREEPGVGR